MSYPGVVAAGNPRTAQIGVQIMEAGGNAIDAAVAANFAAFVTEPILTSPFGGGFATVAGGSHEPSIYDFFANTPGLGLPAIKTQDELDFKEVCVDFGATTQTFYVGRGAMGVTSMLPGLTRLHREHGRLPLETVVSPTIKLAQDGALVTLGVASFMKVLEPILRFTPAAEALFAPKGETMSEGDSFLTPNLAKVLQRLIRGDTVIDDDTVLKSFGAPYGNLTKEDLQKAEVIRRTPLSVPVGHTEVLLNPPPSSGGLLVGFSLRLLDGVKPSVWQDDLQTACHITAATAITNQARARDLDSVLNDPSVDMDAVGRHFLSDTYLDQWREDFFRLAREGFFDDDIEMRHHGSTTHISVVDREGTACSITTSNGEGCGYLVPGAGVLANNFMGEGDLHPHGFFSQPAGQRLTSMMCPTIVLEDGLPDLVLGTGGSNRIRTAVTQVITHHVLRGLSIEEAVRMPRLHYEGRCLVMEHRGPGREWSEKVLRGLQKRVHETVIFENPNMYFGGVHAVDGKGHGFGDPRRSGAVSITR
jgi:gamma-glutamyltranspeptidase / glutathione hydrolase